MFEMCTFASVKFKCFDVMDKIVKLVTLIIQLLTGLIPLIELFGKNEEDAKKVNDALALIKEVKTNQKTNC